MAVMSLLDALCVHEMGWNDETKDTYLEAREMIVTRAALIHAHVKLQKAQEEINQLNGVGNERK